MKKVGGVKVASRASQAFTVRQAATKLAEQLIEIRRGEIEHRRRGIQIPGELLDHLDSAAHHLALAVCRHVGSPCTRCLSWANLEISALAEVDFNEKGKRNE